MANRPKHWNPTKSRPGKRVGLSWRESGGNLYAQARPTHNPSGDNPNSQAWAEFFRRVQQQFPFLHPLEHNGWTATARPGRLYPRDLYTAAMFGRGFGITLPDGRTIMPARSLFDLSRTLDIFDNRSGSILFRDQRLWQSLGPGEPGQVIQRHATRPFVRWTNPPAVDTGVNKLFTLDPVNTPDPLTGDLPFSAGLDPLGGWRVTARRINTTNRWYRWRCLTGWQGQTIVVGLEPMLTTAGWSRLRFGVRRPDTNEQLGFTIDQGDVWPRHIFIGPSDGMLAQGSVLAAGQPQITGNLFLGLQRDGSTLRCLWGQSPSGLVQWGTLTLPGTASQHTEVNLSLAQWGNGLAGIGFRLFHGCTGAP